MESIPTRLLAFLRELKRRRVFRVGLIYLAAGIAIVEVANNFFPALQLPDWTVTLVVVLTLLGLPIALVLAWAFDVTPQGVRRAEATPENAAEAGAAPVRERSAARSLATGAAGVLFVAAAAWVGWTRVGPGPAEAGLPPGIAVMPFTVHAAPDLAYLGAGMVDLLGRNLGAGGARSADPTSVLALVGERNGIVPDLDLQRAQLVSERVGARYFVMGTLTEFGGAVRVQATMFDVDDVRSPIEQVEEQGSDIFQVVDRLSAKLLAAQPLGAMSARLARTAAGTTQSLTALRAYLEGEQAFRRAGMDEAVEAYQRAIAADTGFALAYYRLASAYWWSHNPDRHPRSREAAEQALLRQDRLDERDRRLLRAFVALHRGQADEAERLYHDVLSEHPDQVEAQFELADLFHHYNAPRGRPPAEALDHFHNVLRADQGFA